jgi:hypothetical protein
MGQTDSYTIGPRPPGLSRRLHDTHVGRASQGAPYTGHYDRCHLRYKQLCIWPAYYRLCAEEIAPILIRILKLLATGLQLPEGFDYGSLFLIPKDNSLRIDHTRPI